MSSVGFQPLERKAVRARLRKVSGPEHTRFGR